MPYRPFLWMQRRRRRGVSVSADPAQGTYRGKARSRAYLVPGRRAVFLLAGAAEHAKERVLGTRPGQVCVAPPAFSGLP